MTFFFKSHSFPYSKNIYFEYYSEIRSVQACMTFFSHSFPYRILHFYYTQYSLSLFDFLHKTILVTHLHTIFTH